MSAHARLSKEYISIQKDPIPYTIALPNPQNWLEWHFVIYGLSEPYENGYYYGKIQFPVSYPHSPPSMKYLTPNGRFSPGSNICTTMSNYHPEEWTPIWNVRNILTGLISFMFSNEYGAGSEIATNSKKKLLAVKSKEWNLNNSDFVEYFSPYFDELFKGQNLQVVVKSTKTNKVLKVVKDNLAVIVTVGVLIGFYLAKTKT